MKDEHLNLLEKTQDTLNLEHFEVQPPNVDFEVTDSRQKCYLWKTICEFSYTLIIFTPNTLVISNKEM